MNPTSLNITHCPNCGSDQIKKVCSDWTGVFHGQSYVVPELAFYECPVCGERVFDRAAMRRIQACSPAYKQGRKTSQSPSARAAG